MAPIKNVIVIGASGGIGASVFKGIAESSKFNVSVLARQESENTYAANIRVFKSDYTEASLLEALKGQDAVVSILGPAGLGEQVKLIDAAVKTGVKLFIPSEFSINTLSDKARELVPLFEGKLDVIEYLKKQESKGLSWTAISAGPAFAYGLQLGLAGFNIQTHEALIFDGGNRVFSNSNLSQIGNAVVAVLSKPETTANEFIYIDSFTATQNEILAELETATGKKWNVTNTTSEVATKEGQELLGKGEIFPGLLMLLKTINLGDGFGSNFPKHATYANAKLGLPKQSLKESAAAVAAGGSI